MRENVSINTVQEIKFLFHNLVLNVFYFILFTVKALYSWGGYMFRKYAANTEIQNMERLLRIF